MDMLLNQIIVPVKIQIHACSSGILDFYTTVNNTSESYPVHVPICLCRQYNIIWIEETWSRGHETSTSHWSTLSMWLYWVHLPITDRIWSVTDKFNTFCIECTSPQTRVELSLINFITCDCIEYIPPYRQKLNCHW